MVSKALGGLFLGLGLGVRVTYLALIPTMAYAAYQVNKRVSGKKITLWGGAGLAIGVFLWLGYLLVQFTPYKVYRKLLSHADYHFYREGNSIITTDDYSERFFDIFHNLSAHSLGTWWTDTPFLRIIPTIIIALAFVCFFFMKNGISKIGFCWPFYSLFFVDCLRPGCNPASYGSNSLFDHHIECRFDTWIYPLC